MQKPTLGVVVASTRPGRVGRTVGDWFLQAATAHGGFEVKDLDLAHCALPLLDEPEHPRLKKYENPHTKRWSEAVHASDAFVFVTPEYDFAIPATLLNALQYLYSEWNYKACAFVSYGGLSAGLRSVQTAKTVCTSLKMMPIVEAVAIPFISKELKDGVFQGSPTHEQSARLMLDELARWTGALKTLRT